MERQESQAPNHDLLTRKRSSVLYSEIEKKLKIGNTYTYLQLCKAMHTEENTRKTLVVYDIENNCQAIAHCLQQKTFNNFNEGEVIFFYDDGEVHGANDNDKFTIRMIIEL